jgi:predicted nucleotidyltransferase
MNIFEEEHQEILKALLEKSVNFMLIGGYAVIFHGYRRTTGNMDI